MSNPLLTIAILSIPARADDLSRLLRMLSHQITSDVEVLIALDTQATKARKRNQLLDAARGDYIAYVDDDDVVSSHYVESIVKALETFPDCVTFRVARYVDSEPVGESIHRLGNDYVSGRGTGIYPRPPNHLCPVYTLIARQIRFNDVEMEDIDYALRLQSMLQTEVYVDEVLYEYWLRSEKQVGE